MNNNRNYIDTVLVIALIILGVFLFNRVQNLNTTQTELGNAQAEITQVADLAATYAEEGTAVAESAAAAARLAADELGYANSTATQSAADNANALEAANAVATQSAADSADALDSANSTATQAAADSALSLANANSTATRSANIARTQTANAASTQAAAQTENAALSANLSNAEATNSALLELQATGQAERETLESEIVVLSTAQAQAQDMANMQMTAIVDVKAQLDSANEANAAQAAANTQAEATIAAQATPDADLGRLVVTHSIDRDGCPTDDVSVLENVDSIYIVAPNSTVDRGVDVFARLLLDNTPIEDTPIITADRDYTNVCVNFVFEKTDGSDFEPGNYEVEFWVNGNEYNSVTFRIE